MNILLEWFCTLSIGTCVLWARTIFWEILTGNRLIFVRLTSWTSHLMGRTRDICWTIALIRHTVDVVIIVMQYCCIIGLQLVVIAHIRSSSIPLIAQLWLNEFGGLGEKIVSLFNIGLCFFIKHGLDEVKRGRRMAVDCQLKGQNVNKGRVQNEFIRHIQL